MVYWVPMGSWHRWHLFVWPYRKLINSFPMRLLHAANVTKLHENGGHAPGYYTSDTFQCWISFVASECTCYFSTHLIKCKFRFHWYIPRAVNGATTHERNNWHCDWIMDLFSFGGVGGFVLSSFSGAKCAPCVLYAQFVEFGASKFHFFVTSCCDI